MGTPDDRKRLLALCWDLIASQGQCVLATQGEAGPHCSLMSHLADPGSESMYLVTARHTGKFRNITAAPRVSLLVDDRDGREPGTPGRALTISGDCAALAPGPERDRLLARFAAVHPGLAPILEDPDCAVLGIKVKSFQYLDGVTRASFLEL